MCSGRKLAKFKIMLICQNYFFRINFLHAHPQYVSNIPGKYLKDTLNALGGVDITKYALLQIIKYVQWSKIGVIQNTVICQPFFKFFCIKLLHAYLHSVCNIHAKNQQETLKSLGGVDFTKYAQSVLCETLLKLQSVITLEI